MISFLVLSTFAVVSNVAASVIASIDIHLYTLDFYYRYRYGRAYYSYYDKIQVIRDI